MTDNELNDERRTKHNTERKHRRSNQPRRCLTTPRLPERSPKAPDPSMTDPQASKHRGTPTVYRLNRRADKKFSTPTRVGVYKSLARDGKDSYG